MKKPVDDVLRGLERAISRRVKAARIFPHMLESCEDLLREYVLLKELKNVGVEEVFIGFPLGVVGCSRRPHPYPPEVALVIKMCLIKGVFPMEVYGRDGEAYVLVRLPRSSEAHYAVVKCRWIDPLGEPDIDYRGLRAYSPERIGEYARWCLDYLDGWRGVLDSSMLEVARKSITEDLGKVLEEAEAFILGDFKVEEWMDGHLLAKDERLLSKGILMLKVPRLACDARWVCERGESRLYAVLREDVEEAIREKYREWCAKKERKRVMEEEWLKALNSRMIMNYVARVKLEEVEDLVRAMMDGALGDKADVAIELIKRLCEEEVYFVESWHVYRVSQSVSAHDPLSLLYVVRMFRDAGIDVGVGRRVRDLPLPKVLICVGEFYLGRRLGWWRLLVKPKKGLRVEYPCEVKWEDNSIVVVDRQALAGVLGDGGQA